MRNPESSAQKVSATQKVCATCGNSYARTFAIVQEGKTYYFDCFECAIQALAPRCARCGCRIIGHGAEEGERIFCCAHCARQEGVLLVCDHC
ncbi:MAG TPA: hypothetical protein VMF06_13805 [Candidatus Limnocylindria bacterium]|nr:hypothetical protein [Candidatus Limnocylindria bacterium]